MRQTRTSLWKALAGLPLIALGLGMPGGAANADPILQLYGGPVSQYDNGQIGGEQSWVYYGGQTMQLWIAGLSPGSGGANGSIDGILHNVTLVAAYNTSGPVPTIGFKVA